ncbi:transketolase family protein [Bordetella bronchialis]|uniref:Transketolase n=1 Tax=Bordetella bronchialis TaxID=463025 RepID=A0A193G2L6_9BORD|nr:transketolase C-terminal domain-containing protein [Bordetella bronchialis]ANN74247.1 transketolase [Bordetella bronchialis]
MRSAFSRAIVAAAQKDPRTLLLTGDHGYALFDDFRRAAPAQFINAGVAEQNMVGVAAGLAKAGFRPIVYGLSAFVPVRVLEQIKLDVCYEGLPVIFIGDGAGVVYSTLGASHQSTEDIAALRAIRDINIFSPADAAEMTYVMDHALQASGPSYIRMGKADLGDVHTRPIGQPIGELVACQEPRVKRTAVIATGSMVRTAQQLCGAADDIGIWSAPAIHPLDRNQVQHIAREYGTIVVLEEHAAAAGLGGLVAEIVGELEGNRARVLRMGTEGGFSLRCGSYQYLLKEHGIDLEGLRRKFASQGVVV